MTQAHGGVALARARAFVRAHGDALARTRLETALGEAPPAALVEALRPLARPEGAFAAGPAEPGSFAGTFAALTWLDEARALDTAEATGAVAWLTAAQQPDGAWDPPGACAGGRLVATALTAALLARTPCARPAPRRRAAAFLAAHWAPERVAGGEFGALAGFARHWAHVDHELSDPALQWCGRELERGFREGRLDALQAARVLVLCDARSLPGSRLDADRVVHALAASQDEDGGWRAGAPDPLRVAATVEGALALARLGTARARG
jgi:hypothetical protein